MTSKDRQGYPKISTWEALFIGLLSFCASLPIEAYILPEKGKLLCLSLFVFMTTLYTFRSSIRAFEVKIVAFGYAAIHLLLTIFIPLRDSRYPGAALIPLGLLEYSICFAIINRNLSKQRSGIP